MADTVLVAAVTAAGGLAVAVLSGVISYRTARWSLRRDLEVDLRRQRLEAYKNLWSLLEPLAQYARPAPVTAASLRQLASGLRRWYYEQGGMFLTERSRDACFTLQTALQKVTEGATKEDQALDEERIMRLRDQGRTLRETLEMSFRGFPRM